MGFLMLALPWLKRFGPWIAVGLVAFGVYIAASTIVKDWKKSIHDTAFAEGTNKERDRQDAIARRIETVLGPRLDAIDQNTSNQLKKQNQVETVYVDRIRDTIKNNPMYTKCVVDDGVLRDRNALRQSLEATINPSTGTNTVGAPAAPSTNN